MGQKALYYEGIKEAGLLLTHKNPAAGNGQVNKGWLFIKGGRAIRKKKLCLWLREGFLITMQIFIIL